MNQESEIREMYLEVWKTGPTPDPGPGFLAKCEEAIHSGIELRPLSAACGKLGFLGVPLDYYLTEAARESGVALGPLLKSMMLKAQHGWISLGRALSLPSSELALMIRAMFAQSLMPAGPASRYRTAAPARSQVSLFHPGASPLEYDTLLRTLEATYDPAAKQALASLLEHEPPA